MTDGRKRLTRRDALSGVGALVGGAALGACSSEDGEDRPAPGGSEPDPSERLQSIETIVVVMMENRSFDTYFGALKLVEGRDIDGLTGSESNPDPAGSPISVYELGDDWTTAPDPPHGWDASHAQFNAGMMDGFVREYARDAGPAELREVMGYFTRSQLPVLYTFADEYALCERWFASVMGPTWPNRFHLHCGTSNGVKTNSAVQLRSIWNQLEEAGIDATYYASGLPFAFTFGKTSGTKRIADFYSEAQNGTLPPVCYVDPVLTTPYGIGNDDHPPADIRDGQAFLASIYQALAQSPQWDQSLLVITYDEHGGFYDHVPPPTTTDDLEEFRQLGFRVPSVVVGPQVKQGFRCATVLDHVSVVTTIQRRFGLLPLNARVAATHDLSVVLDPALAAAPRAPVELPAVELPRELAFLPDRKVGGQTELAALVEREFGFDWRAESERALRVIREQAVRLGVARFGR